MGADIHPECLGIVLVGSQSLLLRCAEHVLDGPHALRGVVSRDPAVRLWADENGVPWLGDVDTVAARPPAEPFDVLFSIANFERIPPALLTLPERLAANFHDGPLPELAGRNVTTWALSEGASEHAITWHRMDASIDTGSILVERRFPIDPDETAFSLNVRCFDEAFEGFVTLLEALATGTLVDHEQSIDKVRRHFRRGALPEAVATLDWTAPGETLAAAARALDFGDWPNPLGLAKAWHDGQALSVRRIEPLDVGSNLPPGTVVAVGHEHLQVTTGSVDVRLHGLATLAGEALTAASLAVRFAIVAGARLDRAEPAERHAVLTALSAAVPIENERARVLATVEALDLPLARERQGQAQGQGQGGSHRQMLAGAAVSRQPGADGEAARLIALFGLLLARLGGLGDGRQLCIPVVAHEPVKALASRLPLCLVLDEAASVDAWLGTVRDALQRLEREGAHAADMLQRRLPGNAAARRWQDGRLPAEVDRVGLPFPILDAGVVLRLVEGESASLTFRDDLYDARDAARIAGMFETLRQAAGDASRPVQSLPLVADDPHAFDGPVWQGAATERSATNTVHALFSAQASREPARVALISGGREFSYATIEQRANRLAQTLLESGVAPRSFVGLLLGRSERAAIGMLGILKAGCAYVPLDPAYPAERLGYVAEHAGFAALVTEEASASSLAAHVHSLPRIFLDDPRAEEPDACAPSTDVKGDDAAYRIYTSGSSGLPKGVTVEHGNVCNFFVGMDERVPRSERDVWLAVTSLSFDISVLELLWTLARGFTVVMHDGADRLPAGASPGAEPVRGQSVDGQSAAPDFGLFYFASAAASDPDTATPAAGRYDLLLDGARFADANGFVSVWTPERHFHAFGGLYPNPAVTGAAVAAVTERVAVRSGSCVLPLHHPARVAEEWAVVDNLSGGRAGISFATGWQPDDFVIRPDAYDGRHAAFDSAIDQVRRLWRGEKVRFRGPEGDIDVATLPRPVQAELPFWVTAAGNPETFRSAGALGANLLTHLLGQSIEALADKITIYREARRAAGHVGSGTVSLMLHTFVDDDEAVVRARVAEPMKAYLRSSAGLIKQYASAFPAFSGVAKGEAFDRAFAELIDEDMDQLLDIAFERYYQESGLFGTPAHCADIALQLAAHGVDEIACLIDFGVDDDAVMAALPALARARQLAADKARVAPAPVMGDSRAAAPATIPELMTRHGVSHLQCTPSLARMLLEDSDGARALAALDVLIVGGEALAPELADRLTGLCDGVIINAYGPTETTVWSTTARVSAGAPVSIGTPISNTVLRIVDARLRVVPDGVPGELLIGGAGVARGYAGQPALTAERFIDDPLAPGSGERFYRSGDLVCLNDGRLECLGRLDDQLKIRGHRIEPAEIERVLSEQVEVGDAVVIVREDAPGEHRLVAYITAEAGVDTAGLRRLLAERLPAYMVPEVIVVLPALPLTPNLKRDRRALPAPEAVSVVMVKAVDGPIDGPIDRPIDGQVDRQSDEHVDGQVDRQIDEQIERPVTVSAAKTKSAGGEEFASDIGSTREVVSATAGATDGSGTPTIDVRPADSDIEATIASTWREILGGAAVGRHDNFFDSGGNSLLAVRTLGLLRERLTLPLKMTDIFRFPTIASLATHLDAAHERPSGAAASAARSAAQSAAQSVPQSAAPSVSRNAHPASATPSASDPVAPGSRASGSPIAIIGLAGRFPGAADVGTFWKNIEAGIESVTTLDDEELRAGGVPEALLANADYVKCGAFLDDADRFDADFFGVSPQDAAIMDPQHRHFLEVSWQALESAGIDPSRSEASIGVFGGSGHHAYLPHNLQSHPELVEEVGFFLLRHTGNDKDFLTTRVSYEFDLTGPSVNVQTACSTSLVAAHMACQSLLAGECDVALAGGVTIELPLRHGYLYKDGEVASPDGHCRPFDAASAGTYFGSGVGVVVLKRLDEALAHGDTVHAVIRGSAINNDGAGKVSYFAPSVDAQAAAIEQALADADVDPDSVDYVEAHGTGTPLGDPIEVAALNRIYGTEGRAPASCSLGSVKGNIGHLDTAAGVAGLIKAVQALRHRRLPPTLHFRTPNPDIAFEDGPFRVDARTRDWANGATPRRAGVSSLGVGGTNAHVVLEEAPPQQSLTPQRGWQLLPLSARSPAALARASDALAEFLAPGGRSGAAVQAGDEAAGFADIAWTLQSGRRAFEVRQIVVGRSAADAADALAGEPSAGLCSLPVLAAETASPIAFLFAGGGAQFSGMSAELYASEPVYRATVERCLDTLVEPLASDVHRLLLDDKSDENSLPDASAEGRDSERPSRALPALFIAQLAQARLWASWGVTPAALLGHSMGEYTAACLAGVFDESDALAIVAERGRLFETLAPGAMLSVMLDEASLLPLLGESLSLAAVNAATLCVAAGPIADIAALERVLTEQDIDYRRVPIGVAAHSAMLEPILAPFAAFLEGIDYRRPHGRLVSNVSGDWVDAEAVVTPAYWVEHLRQTVRFGDGLSTLTRAIDPIMLEVGPGRIVASLVEAAPVLVSSRNPRDEEADTPVMLNALGQLWLAGHDIDWRALHGDDTRLRVPLPTYSFERTRHWLAPGSSLAASPGGATVGGGDPAGSARRAPDDWFERPVWKHAPLPPRPEIDPAEADDSTADVLLFREAAGSPGAALADVLTRELARAGRNVISVYPGESFRRRGKSVYVSPESVGDHESLIEALEGSRPELILHLWNVDDGISDLERALSSSLAHGLHALSSLAAALSGVESPVRLIVVSTGLHALGGEMPGNPAKAALLGPCQVIPTELPHVEVRSVDIRLESHPRLLASLADAVLAETIAPLSTDDAIVVWRAGQRHASVLEPCRLTRSDETPLMPEGVYLISGGISGIGTVLAEHLMRRYDARVVFLGRSAIPDGDAAEAWLASHGPEDPVAQRLVTLRELRRAGGEVMTVPADVSDPAAVSAALQRVKVRFGRLDGVFHTAGVLDDALLAQRDPAAAEAVLAPKVLGTLALDKAINDVFGGDLHGPFVLFSSTSTRLGLAGQADYAAANAFLDAYARARHARDGTPVRSIGWDAWESVGMAARLRKDAHAASSERVHSQRLQADSDWFIHEHRTADGVAVLPGTAYLALMLEAVCAERGKFEPITLADVRFATPLALEGQDSACRLEVALSAPCATQGAVAATPGTARVQSWQSSGLSVHAEASVLAPATTATTATTATAATAVTGETIDIDAIVSRCADMRRDERGIEHEHMHFGARWDCVEGIRYGRAEALIELALPEPFVDDLARLRLHPALLDMATGRAQALIPDIDPAADFYVPLAYEKVRILAPLEQRIVAHVRLASATRDDVSMATFDVTVADPAGRVLVAVEGFTMIRVEALDVTTTTAANPSQAPLGILPDEGMDALERVLQSPWEPAIFVSPRSIAGAAARSRVERGTDAAADTGAIEGEGRDASRLRAPRPSTLSTPHVAPRNDTERAIASVWEDLLGIEGIGVDDDFFALGGHSLRLTQAIARVRSTLSQRLPLSRAFDQPTVAGWAALALRSGASASTASPADEPEEISGPVPLTPGQHRFLNERETPDPHRWNIAGLFDAREPLDIEALQRTFERLLDTHDALRTRFTLTDGRWQAFIEPPGNAPPVRDIDLSTDIECGSDADPGSNDALARACDALQSSFELARGPLFQMARLQASGEPATPERLLLIVHHLVADALSWTILLEDFSVMYTRDVRGEAPRALERTSSCVRWTKKLHARATSRHASSAATRWSRIDWTQIRPLPSVPGAESDDNTNASAAQLSVVLPKAESALLIMPPTKGQSVENCVLAALGAAVAEWCGARSTLIDVMGHGREEGDDLDLARSVGFFIDYTPVLVPGDVRKTADGRAPFDAIERMRRAGVEHDALRFFADDRMIREKMAGVPRAEVLYNHLGHRDEAQGTPLDAALFVTSAASGGATHSPKGLRQHALAVKSVIADGQVVLTFVYSVGLNEKADIRELADATIRRLGGFARERRLAAS